MSYLQDTWSLADTAGYWVIRLRDVQNEPNHWTAEVARKSIKAFSGLVSPVSVNFSTIAEESLPLVALHRGDEPSHEFIERMFRSMVSYGAPIYAAEIFIELIAYARTQESPDVPVRMSLDLGDFFRISPSQSGEPISQVSFTLEHTLFSPHNLEGENRLLHLLNQPLLEAALKRWEQAIGPIVDWSGAEGVYRYGFTP